MSVVTQATVNNIVSSRNRSATVSTIKKFCDGLGITIEAQSRGLYSVTAFRYASGSPIVE